MSLEGQFIVVISIVGLAAAYVARSAWKTWFGKKTACGSGCGKCGGPPAGPPPKGRIELPQV